MLCCFRTPVASLNAGVFDNFSCSDEKGTSKHVSADKAFLDEIFQ